MPDIDLTALGPWAAVLMLLIRVVQEFNTGSRKVLTQAMSALAAVEKILIDSRIAQRDSRTGLLLADQVQLLHKHLLRTDEDGNIRPTHRIDLERLGASLDKYASQTTAAVQALRALLEVQGTQLEGLEQVILDDAQVRQMRERERDRVNRFKEEK